MNQSLLQNNCIICTEACEQNVSEIKNLVRKCKNVCHYTIHDNCMRKWVRKNSDCVICHQYILMDESIVKYILRKCCCVNT